MRIAGIIDESIVDGVGVRWVVFAQGCPHRCKGCHNEKTWDAELGYPMTVDELIKMLSMAVSNDTIIQGITISGGEPFAQAKELAEFARLVKEHTELDVWIYTGWTLKQIIDRGDPDELALLDTADVLVDGPYIEELRTLDRRFVGSSNQHIWHKDRYGGWIKGSHS